MSVESSPLSSALSSPPSSDDEMAPFLLSRKSSPAQSPLAMSSPPATASTPSKGKKREPSPAHEDVLADNPDIAFLVMFRARFSDAFSAKLINFGPQDIERGVVDIVPSPQVENLMCALLGLVLNRKKPVERGHHGRALEEAVQSQKSQWPRAWNGVNPLSGSRNFNTMNPAERLTLLKALALWALHTSDAISTIIKDSYKQNRHDDDLNQPLSVQRWGQDALKRRYWLIEGRDDTSFRLYRESNPAQKRNTWWSVAGSIDELRGIAEKLSADGSQAGRRLSERITNSIPRFEATEEKRKRREYRQTRKAQFSRPDPGFSLYEGRTRGKRARYTFSDDDDEDELSLSDVGLGNRRSARTSGLAGPGGATTTASGREVRQRVNGRFVITTSGDDSTAGGSPAMDNYGRSDASEEPATRSGREDRNRRVEYNIEAYDQMDASESEEAMSYSSGDVWDGEDGADVKMDDEDDDDISEGVSEEELGESKSLIVTLQYGKHRPGQPTQQPTFTTEPAISMVPNVETATVGVPSTFAKSSITVPQVLQHQNPQGTNLAQLPTANGTLNKSDSPAGPVAGADQKPLPSFSNFLYKPSHDVKPVVVPQLESTNRPPHIDSKDSHLQSTHVTENPTTSHPVPPEGISTNSASSW